MFDKLKRWANGLTEKNILTNQAKALGIDRGEMTDDELRLKIIEVCHE